MIGSLVNNLIVSEIERKIDQFIEMEAVFSGCSPVDLRIFIRLNDNGEPIYYLEDNKGKHIKDFSVSDLNIGEFEKKVNDKISEYLYTIAKNIGMIPTKIVALIQSIENGKQMCSVQDLNNNTLRTFKTKELLNL